MNLLYVYLLLTCLLLPATATEISVWLDVKLFSLEHQIGRSSSWQKLMCRLQILLLVLTRGHEDEILSERSLSRIDRHDYDCSRGCSNVSAHCLVLVHSIDNMIS